MLMKSRWMRGVLLMCAVPCLMSCTEKERASASASPPPTPAPLTITASSSGTWYRYVDPVSGTVSTATSIEEVPERARPQVVVYQEAHPTPAGWEQVADLSLPLPLTTSPRRGFRLQTRRGESTASSTRRRSQVVLFSTTWCGYCRKARSFFKIKGVPFSEYDVEKDPKARQKMAELAKAAGVSPASLQGVPIIFVGRHAMSGFDKPRLEKLLNR